MISRNRSSRNKKQIHYKKIHEGADLVLSEGNTEFSAHVASNSHTREDLYSILCMEDKKIGSIVDLRKQS